MSNRSMNTHRRAMRPVTPVVRLGRNVAGVAITAGILVAGASSAMADGENAAAGQDAAAQNTSADTAADTSVDTSADASVVAIPAVKDADSAKGESATDHGDMATATVAAKPKPKPKPKPVVKAAAASTTTSDDDSSSSKSSSSSSSTKSSSSSSSSDDDSSSSSSQGSAKGSSIVSTARSGIGIPYVWGGSSRSGIDCSGFTSWVYAQHGISLPHSSSAQRAMGRTVSRSEARPGDIVYTPGHVGIYAGNGKIIDAGRSPHSVTERTMWGASWTFIRIGG